MDLVQTPNEKCPESPTMFPDLPTSPLKDCYGIIGLDQASLACKISQECKIKCKSVLTILLKYLHDNSKGRRVLI